MVMQEQCDCMITSGVFVSSVNNDSDFPKNIIVGDEICCFLHNPKVISVCGSHQ
jgi:hypothetical protein